MKRFADGAVVDAATDYVAGATACPAYWPETGRECGALATCTGTLDDGSGLVIRSMRCPLGHTFQAVGRRTAWSRRRTRRTGVMIDMRR